MKKVRIVAISGGFDPLHAGHIRHIKAAKRLGDKLIIILSPDDQLKKKKGYVLMPYEERKEILESIVGVAKVVKNIDSDITAAESLKLYGPDVFVKGGNTTPDNLPKEEFEVCKLMGCSIIYGVGGKKIKSSSDLIEGCFHKDYYKEEKEDNKLSFYAKFKNCSF